MMQCLKNNRILTKYIFSVFVVLMLLAPISVSFTEVLTPSVATAQVKEALNLLTNPGVVLGNLILNLASAFTWMGGKLFDLVFTELVFGMGNAMSGSLGSSVDVTWKIIRDICNLAFIFGFVYVGIRTILGMDDHETKRMLSRIIIGALLINFSLFFTKIVIDFSNFTAIQIYNTLTVGGGSISEAIANSLGIVTFYKSPDPATLAGVTGAGKVWFFFMAAIFLLISAFVFFAAALLLIVRFVVLILIMVFSPLLFAATIFPGTKPIASDLWKNLISHSFFAPAYLLLVLVSLTLIKGLSLTKIQGDGFMGLIKSGNTASGDAFSIVLQFCIVIFFMIAALTIAQKMGVAGGDIAIKVGKDVRSRGQQFLGASTFGVGGRLGRATLGRMAYSASESGELKDAASKRGLSGVYARQKLKLARAVGDASFDARNVAHVGNKLGIGEGRKGGYKTVLGEVEEKEMKFAKSLGEVDDDDVRVGAYRKEVDVAEESIKKLRDERSGLGNLPEDQIRRKQIVTEIQQLEKVQKESQQKYSQEKQRRILGSTYSKIDNTNAVNVAKANLKKEEDALNKSWKEYREETNPEAKEIMRGAIEEIQKQVVAAKKKYAYERAQASKDDGYASTLENSSWWNSWPQGRMVVHEQGAGKALRKAFEKKIKKSKEDSRHEELISKLDKK